MYAAEVTGIVLAIASIVLTGVDSQHATHNAIGTSYLQNFQTGLQSKITPVNDAGENEFPFVVYLLNDGNHACTGALIARRWVLTAGHCLTGASSQVVLGDYDRGKTGTSNKQIIDIAEKILYPGYDTRVSTINDVGLIRLASPARIKSASVSTVDILKSASLKKRFLANTKPCKALGWGMSRENKVWYLATKLQQLNIRFVNDSEVIKRGYTPEPTNLIIEAVYENNECQVGGVCNGDSGGPLVCRSRGSWIVVGVSSFYYTTNGCIHGIQGEADVQNHAIWIESIIGA